MNFNNKCDGKWTHEIRTTGSTSVLDYVAIDGPLEKQVTGMLIDEDAIYCPFRVTTKNGVKSTTLSDHNSIILNIKIPRNSTQKEAPTPNWIHAFFFIRKLGLPLYRKLS